MTVTIVSIFHLPKVQYYLNSQGGVRKLTNRPSPAANFWPEHKLKIEFQRLKYRLVLIVFK
jgi:hypothetical protein